MTSSADTTTMQRIAMLMELLEASVPIQRRLLHAGDTLYRAGDRFERLHVLRSGSCKIVDRSADGREQVVALPLRGDWLGFDGIADGRHRCDAIATDVGEVWSMRYDELLRAGGRRPELIAALHGAMSQEIGRDRQVLMSLCSLPADARVADFLRSWADALAERGLRTDRIVLRLSRAEIGNFLGMNLETVSRALSRLARGDVIRFIENQRRAIEIPEVEALKVFIQRSLLPLPAARGARSNEDAALHAAGCDDPTAEVLLGPAAVRQLPLRNPAGDASSPGRSVSTASGRRLNGTARRKGAHRGIAAGALLGPGTPGECQRGRLTQPRSVARSARECR